MPLIQAPQTAPISSSSGLITDPATNISRVRLNPTVVPYLNVGGTLYGERGSYGRPTTSSAPLITVKSDKEIAAVNAMKLQKFKDDLISQGYSEIAPNVFSKGIGGSKYEVINVDAQTGDVISNILGEIQVGLFQLQNRLDAINWGRASNVTRNRLINTANKLGYTIDKGKIIPKGYYVTDSGKVKKKINKETSKNGGWFGTPEGMAIVQGAPHPVLFDYRIQQLENRGNIVELTSRGWRVTPIKDIINMNIATERSNQRKMDRMNTANQQLQNNIFAQKMFSQDKMNLINGNINAVLKDKLFGKGNWK